MFKMSTKILHIPRLYYTHSSFPESRESRAVHHIASDAGRARVCGGTRASLQLARLRGPRGGTLVQHRPALCHWVLRPLPTDATQTRRAAHHARTAYMRARDRASSRFCSLALLAKADAAADGNASFLEALLGDALEACCNC